MPSEPIFKQEAPRKTPAPSPKHHAKLQNEPSFLLRTDRYPADDSTRYRLHSEKDILAQTEDMNLINKTCLVTGATRGMGRAIAKMLAQAGARVAICGRTESSVATAIAELESETGNKVKGKAADVKLHSEVVKLFEYVQAELGPLDILVNNAGIGIFGDVGALSVEDWKATLETNLYGAFYCVQQALPSFETQGGGHIVNIGSMAGAYAFAGGAAYNASKFGLTGFTDAVMQDLRSKNVRVSYVMPGSTATEFGGGDPEAGAAWKIWPEDVAEVVRMMLQMPERTLVSRVEVRPSQPKR